MHPSLSPEDHIRQADLLVRTALLNLADGTHPGIRSHLIAMITQSTAVLALLDEQEG